MAAAAWRTAGPECCGSAAARRDRPPIGRWSRPRCRAVQRSKKRCSADSSSSATTISSWRHLRRDSVQRRRLAASKPIRMRNQDVDGEDRAAAGAQRRHPELDRDHQNDPADQRQPQPMPQQPDHARDRSPEMEAVTDKDELVGRREIGAVGYGSMHCVDRHRTSPPRTKNANKKSAAELTLGGRHFARRARIDRDRGTKRPRQTLEAGFGDMMAVLAI